MKTLQDFIDAKKRIDKVLLKTNLIYSEIFSEESENEVYFKPENTQRTGSFKIRGAYNKMSKLSDEDKKKGVITASAGNHAQGVAYGAKDLGVKSVICMPASTPLIKVNATQSYGAQVVLNGEVYDDAYAKCVELQNECGYTLVHPFNDEDVLEGQGTISLEILEELPDADILLVPVGGGGLISGVACCAKEKNPNIKVIGVEPKNAASAIAALKAGKPVELKEANTIADGTAVKLIGSTNYEYIKKYVDDIMLVDDYELMTAFLSLLEKHKLVAEGSGMLPIAASKKLKDMGITGKKVVCVVSGGNIDVLAISSMINKGLIDRGRIFSFAIDLQDSPGRLTRVTEILSELGANIINIEHNRYKNLDRFKEVELICVVETNGLKHVEEITKKLASEGYAIRNYL